VIETFQAARTTLLGDPHLSDQGKADRIAKLEADARAASTRHAADARQRLEDTGRRHEARSQLPRVPDDDLMAARQDVAALTANVKPGELADRLGFAAKNGGDSASDLLLRDGYAERVLIPARGPEYAADAARWAQAKRELIRERLGPAGEPHLRALDAVPIAAKAATITDYVVSGTFGSGDGA
jgi:hypothetical protein